MHIYVLAFVIIINRIFFILY